MSHCKKIIMTLFLIKCSGLAAAEDRDELNRMRAELLDLDRIAYFCYGALADDVAFSAAEQESRRRLDEIHRALDQIDNEDQGARQAVQQRGVTVGRIEEQTDNLNREAELFRERAQCLAQKIRGEATFLGFVRWACCSCCSRAEEDNQ